jgi:Ca2+-transporting ATPase
MATEIGKIASLLQQHGADRTPLQRRLASLGRLLATAALALTAIVFIGGVALGEPVDTMFLTAVSLAVSAIPEGLPIMVTVALALGARRMAARHALVRTLPTVETLGSVDVICSDKTGTLTENRMLVERVWTPEATYGVSGSGYAPDGAVTPLGDASTRGTDPALDALADVAVACNDAQLHPPTEAGRGWTITGDPTEGALLSFAGKLGVFREELGERAPRVDELAFDADRRRMTTVQTLGGGLSWVATKGAVEAIADALHPEDAVVADEARRAGDAMAADGYRVLAFAEKRVPTPELDLDHAEEGLTLLGLVGMADPPRSDVGASIQTCADAGICPVMITGDDPRTASAIAGRLGILDGCREVVTGAELAELDDAALAERADTIRVYARTDPEQKLRIVNAWKGRDKVVAMTGDGVNDAPALKRADIGVAMGEKGTDVARQAADMVLLDDNFATIVSAVREGRRIFDNIRKFVKYTMTSNAGEIWTLLLAPFFGLPIPLLPIQILWVNLVTDGLPGLALAAEPQEKGVMRRPPRPPEETVFAHGIWQHILWAGALIGGLSILSQAWAYHAGSAHWQTVVFTVLTLSQLAHAMAVRSDTESLLSRGLGSNLPLLGAVLLTLGVQLAVIYLPMAQPIFHTTPLSLPELAVCLLLPLVVLGAVEVEKWLARQGAIYDLVTR